MKNPHEGPSPQDGDDRADEERSISEQVLDEAGKDLTDLIASMTDGGDRDNEGEASGSDLRSRASDDVPPSHDSRQGGTQQPEG